MTLSAKIIVEYRIQVGNDVENTWAVNDDWKDCLYDAFKAAAELDYETISYYVVEDGLLQNLDGVTVTVERIR